MYTLTVEPFTYPITLKAAKRMVFEATGWTGRGDIPADKLAAVNLAEPVKQPAPAYNPATQKISLGAPELVEGSWVLNWTVEDLSEQELLASLPWKTYLDARKAVVVWINNLTTQIEELYPRAVQKRWDEEEEAARAVKADDVNGTSLAEQWHIDMMTNEGAKKGRTPVEHADAVIFNADRFRSIANRTNELFLETDAKLQAAASPLEFPAIFAWAQQQAAPLAAEHGLEVEQ